MPLDPTKPKTALVLEGGGMRSSYLAGVLLAFHEHNLKFDVVVGSSAGACCGAHYVTGEPEKSKIILEDHLTGNRFVKLKNIFSSGNIVDIDFFIDEICRKRVPFDITKLKNSSATLFITATDYLTGEVTYFNNRNHDIFEALRASCAMPYLYRKHAIYEGRRYMDGGIVEAIPVKKAIEEGCQNIIVVGTRHRGYQKRTDPLPNWLHRFSFNEAMVNIFQKRAELYNKTIRFMNTPQKDISITYVAPKTKLPVGRATRNKNKVIQAREIGYADGLEVCATL